MPLIRTKQLGDLLLGEHWLFVDDVAHRKPFLPLAFRDDLTRNLVSVGCDQCREQCGDLNLLFR